MLEMMRESWNTLCLLAPWLLLGSLLAGLLHVALPADWLRRKLQGRSGVWKAVALGIPLPLCSCGVIPAGIGLKKNGASDGASLAFLISTPQTGVDSILVSASFFGWPFAFFKMLLAAVTGVTGGLLAADSRDGLSPQDRLAETGPPGTAGWLIRLLQHAIEIIRSIWKWLAAGVLVSAAISIWIVPTEWFTRLGESGILVNLMVMLLVSLPLYVCATASVPIAATLVAGGMPVAAALVFLIAGPATNFATIGAVFSQFGLRNTGVYLLTIILGSVLGALAFDALWGQTATSTVEHVHEHGNWFSLACGALLLAMFACFLAGDLRRHLRKARSAAPLSGETLSQETQILQVQGMNCQNCVNKIESSLLKVPDVQRAEVDLETGQLRVAGRVSWDRVRKTVESAGFRVSPDPVKPADI